MRLLGPERYRLKFTGPDFISLKHLEPSKFSGLATTKKPKVYIVSVANIPIYVGTTRQKIRDRLRYGWSAKGKSGYYGYKWRHEYAEIDLDVWLHDDAVESGSSIDIETLEAEIVFLIRAAGQWPLGQTEIHFHPSTDLHRQLAAQIFSSYKSR